MSNSRFIPTLSKFYRNYREKFVYSNRRIQQQNQMSVSTQTTALYEEIKNVKNNRNVLLIDVRDRTEISSTGEIPGSINIPLSDLENALKNLSVDEFQRKYRRAKPAKDFPIIFSCYSGKRAGQAREIAKRLGYECSRIYSGSWKEWAMRNGLPG